METASPDRVKFTAGKRRSSVPAVVYVGVASPVATSMRSKFAFLTTTTGRASSRRLSMPGESSKTRSVSTPSALVLQVADGLGDAAGNTAPTG